MHHNELAPDGRLRFAGWPDWHLTNVDDNQLLRNDGVGTFSARTAIADIEELRWSPGAVFVDSDSAGDENLPFASV